MITRRISSLQHPLVKQLVALRCDKEVRKAKNRALLIGCKMVEELQAITPLELLIIAEGSYCYDAKECIEVPMQVLKKITGVENPEPVAAVVSLPPAADLSNLRYIVAIDSLSDPGNLGTLLRSALCLGWEGVFVTEGTVDPFNDKALRAAKGATFRLPLKVGPFEELLSLAEGKELWVADSKGKSLETIAVHPPLILLFSSEAKGVRSDLCTQATVSVPMSGSFDSLNVAAAGAILLYALKTR